MVEFEYAHFRSETELRIGVLMWQIISPFLILFGTACNIISIIVLSGRYLYGQTSTVYFLGLAIADLFVLHVGLLLDWMKYVSGIDIKLVHPFFCKTSLWLIYACLDTSVWILMAITVERAFFPTRNTSTRTKFHAKLSLMLIAFGALIINSHFLVGFGTLEIVVDNTTMEMPCSPLSKEYADFLYEIWMWIDMCKFSLIPFTVLITGNIWIIHNLIASKRRINPSSIITQPSLLQHQRTYNILLVALSAVFISCTLPISVYFIGEIYWIPKDVPMAIKHQDPWWAFVNMLMYTNSCLNFVLYCVTGSRFRAAVKQMCALNCGRCC